jgi:hypothetical protein
MDIRHISYIHSSEGMLSGDFRCPYTQTLATSPSRVDYPSVATQNSKINLLSWQAITLTIADYIGINDSTANAIVK